MEGRNFWRTKDGEMALDRLDAWGQIERLKANGGLALVSKSGVGAGGASLGEPSMGTAFFKAADVDATLKAWRNCRRSTMDRLLRAMYVDGTQEVLISSKFYLVGGDVMQMSAEEIRDQGEPGRFASREDKFAFKRVFDLSKFEDAWVDTVVTRFFPDVVGSLGMRRTTFLLYLHLIFAETMISYRGIGQGAPRLQGARVRSSAAREQEPVTSYAIPSAADLQLITLDDDDDNVPEMDDGELLRRAAQ